MKANEREKLELKLLLDAIYEHYGYDFRDYARASIKRRIHHFLTKTDYKHISELIPQLLHDEDFFVQLVREFSVPVSEMFRDPLFFKCLRETVIPFLKTYPFIKIWHAGCATGEEVYSLAILLMEEGLYQRTTIYATDFNDDVLKKAKSGIFSIDSIKQYTLNYQQSGGKGSFSEYYHAQYDFIKMNHDLKENITFANHNLVSDHVFGEMHLILCRNVLIYFNRNLQDRVFNLLNDSMIYKGFLCIGSKETLRFASIFKHYETLNEKEKVYRKIEL